MASATAAGWQARSLSWQMAFCSSGSRSEGTRCVARPATTVSGPVHASLLSLRLLRVIALSGTASRQRQLTWVLRIVRDLFKQKTPSA